MKSVLILSGGLDSTVSSWIAREKTSPAVALTFDYGQRAARQEVRAAKETADLLGVPHKVIALPWFAEITRTSLVNIDAPLPLLKEADLDDTDRSFSAASAVWVPNRNGVFLNIAAAFAESLGAGLLVTGFNAEEGVTFPDNSPPFVRAAEEAFWYSTLNKVRVTSYTLHMTKKEIVRQGKELGVNFGRVWFCYDGGDQPCRRCESCLRSLRAFRAEGVDFA